jgi:hypothetical protein
MTARKPRAGPLSEAAYSGRTVSGWRSEMPTAGQMPAPIDLL